MARQEKAESFWRFSLMVYGRPGVADALIRLQDRGGHNVNLILFGLWFALCEGGELDAAALDEAKKAVTALDRDVVLPLRRLRVALRDHDDPDVRDLRRRMLALEIAAERRAQTRLVAGIAHHQPMGDDSRWALAEANLRLILGSDFASEEAAVLRRLAAPA
jgi:uncharacterized protein (TIGR02444 family)